MLVSNIESGFPASRSQVQEGDIIVSFNGKVVNSTNDLFKELIDRSVLNLVDISVIRNTELLKVNIAPVEK